ncbi:MAG: hypothetical protein ABJC89_05470 [Acidobacteriota bacterium]
MQRGFRSSTGAPPAGPAEPVPTSAKPPHDPNPRTSTVLTKSIGPGGATEQVDPNPDGSDTPP